jgi:heme-degrading monooxygenase HmoA
MIVVVFVITLRPDLPAAEYEETGTRMVELVSAMPGFLGMDYAQTEGGELLIARFESHEALAAWRNQPEHKVAQALGRERFFASYRIEVCEAVRSYEFELNGGRSPERRPS